MFLQVSVIHSVHRGGGVRGFIWGVCVVLFGGCAWFYSGGMRGFIQGGMCGFIRGACMVLFGGACMVLFGEGGVHGFIWGVWFYLGGMCGFIRGVCMVLFGGACMVFSVFSDTMRYGQWVGGTHPTGMHSCSIKFYWKLQENKENWTITKTSNCIYVCFVC